MTSGSVFFSLLRLVANKNYSDDSFLKNFKIIPLLRSGGDSSGKKYAIRQLHSTKRGDQIEIWRVIYENFNSVKRTIYFM